MGRRYRSVMVSSTKPRILVLNQYYWPGVEATAQLLSQLCEGLADEFELTVVTGQLHGHGALASREERNGVHVIRVRGTSFERSRLHLRAANYASYLADTVLTAMRAKKPDLVLCMTDPPIVGDVGLLVARRFRVPLLVISQDVFPEVAEKVKRIESKVALGVLRGLVRLYLERADTVVAIGETMKRRLEDKGAPPDRVKVIPNWVDTSEITPRPRDNAWAEGHRLDEAFVLMHSGNIGHAQDLDTLVRAATFLRDLDDLRIVIAGFGARHSELTALAVRLEVTEAVRFLPYQPREVLAESLSAAEMHFVGLAKGLSGYVVPSRLYGILAAGRPVIVGADGDSETARLVTEVGCGVVLPPGRPELVAGVVREARNGMLDLEEMGARGRAFVEERGGRESAFRSYRAVIAGTLNSR